MKYLLCLFILFAGFTLVFAQDTTVVKRKKYVARTEVGYNFFVGNGADSLKNNAEELGSTKFNYVYQKRYYWGESPVYVAPGLGIGIFEWRFTDPLILQQDVAKRRLLVISDPDTLHEYGKSKLQVTQLMLPIEFGLQAGHFNFAVGAHAGLLLFAKHKRKYRQDGVDIRTKEDSSRELQLNPLHYGVQARIAWKGIGVYGLYQLSNLFNDRGPEVNAVQIGITFSRPTYSGQSSDFLKKLRNRGKSI